MGRETSTLQLLAPLLLTGGKGADLVIRGNVVLNTLSARSTSTLPRNQICIDSPSSRQVPRPSRTVLRDRLRFSLYVIEWYVYLLVCTNYDPCPTNLLAVVVLRRRWGHVTVEGVLALRRSRVSPEVRARNAPWCRVSHALIRWSALKMDPLTKAENAWSVERVGRSLSLVLGESGYPWSLERAVIFAMTQSYAVHVSHAV
jgi:hypothetical protein